MRLAVSEVTLEIQAAAELTSFAFYSQINSD